MSAPAKDRWDQIHTHGDMLDATNVRFEIG